MFWSYLTKEKNLTDSKPLNGSVYNNFVNNSNNKMINIRINFY